MTAQGEMRKTLGLSVAKATIRASDPSVLDIVFHGDAQTDDAVRRASLRNSAGPIAFPGVFTLSVIDSPNSVAPFELEAKRTGAVGYDLTLRRGAAILGYGMGLIDPDDAQSLLISAWSGETKPYGIVKYTIRDAQTITGYYISLMSPDVPGGDKATGDTSNGFPGRYELNSLEESGRKWGPHDWAITQRGEIFDLTWTERGKIFCRGFGIADPADAKSIIVNYIAI